MQLASVSGTVFATAGKSARYGRPKLVARAQVEEWSLGAFHPNVAKSGPGARAPRPENAPGDFYVDHACIGKHA
jgi:hypothetical protein